MVGAVGVREWRRDLGIAEGEGIRALRGRGRGPLVLRTGIEISFLVGDDEEVALAGDEEDGSEVGFVLDEGRGMPGESNGRMMGWDGKWISSPEKGERGCDVWWRDMRLLMPVVSIDPFEEPGRARRRTRRGRGEGALI